MVRRAIKLLIPLVVVLIAIVIAKVMIGSRPALPTSDAEIPLPHVKTIEVDIGDVPVSIVAYGSVSARHELELASEVTGRVVWVAPEFEPGEMVTAGTVLLRVDAVTYRLALAEANAALVRSNNELADAKALKRKASAAEAKLNIEASRQRIIKAEQDLAYTEIRAPFNAVIDKQLVEFGQFINTGQTVARLLSSDTAEVTLPVSAADSGFLDLAVNAPVVLTAKIGAQQRQWQATLLRVESRVDRQTRVVPVVVEVASPYDNNVHAHTLPLGLFVEAHIPGRPISSAVRLPRSALQADGSVFVLSDNVLRRRQVTIAHREGDIVVISAGLAAGDRVVVTRLEVMFEGMKVEPGDA
jgi:RND family efflux transporter MFP subunit